MKKLIYFIIFLIVYTGTGHAQSDTLATEIKVPVLNGHRFPSMGQFRSSFINTSIRANMGFGYTSPIKIGGITIDDHEILSFEGQILFLNLGIQYQQRFTPWLAAYLSYNLVGRVGTNMATIMADGVNTLTGSEIGWLIRVMHNKKFNLSAMINLKNMTGNFINVKGYFEDLINNNSDPAIIKEVPAMTVGTGIQGAYAFNSTYGLQFQSEIAYGESFERSKTTVNFTGGIMGDIDFLPKHNVPIGLALGYTLSSQPEVVMSEGGVSNVFAGKIGYTGSDDFELGLRFTYYSVELESVDEKPYVSTVMLLMKFYF